jgi:hypothetical protein
MEYDKLVHRNHDLIGCYSTPTVYEFQLNQSWVRTRHMVNST